MTTKSRKQPPAYNHGDIVGDLMITEYVGRICHGDSPIPNHVYKTVCICGNHREVTQPYINKMGNRACCRSCGKKRSALNAPVSNRRDYEAERLIAIENSRVISMNWRSG